MYQSLSNPKNNIWNHIATRGRTFAQLLRNFTTESCSHGDNGIKRGRKHRLQTRLSKSMLWQVLFNSVVWFFFLCIFGEDCQKCAIGIKIRNCFRGANKLQMCSNRALCTPYSFYVSAKTSVFLYF